VLLDCISLASINSRKTKKSARLSRDKAKTYSATRHSNSLLSTRGNGRRTDSTLTIRSVSPSTVGNVRCGTARICHFGSDQRLLSHKSHSRQSLLLLLFVPPFFLTMRFLHLIRPVMCVLPEVASPDRKVCVTIVLALAFEFHRLPWALGDGSIDLCLFFPPFRKTVRGPHI
jgi:hypothetical protein